LAPANEICPLLTLTLETLIRPQLEVFFERVYPMIPVFPHDEVMSRINGAGLNDRDFVAMILTMTALSLVHPLKLEEAAQKPTRARQATMLLDEACRLSARWDYGCASTIEGVLTSYLMFGTLFELGHAAGARMRLRESISMGEAMKLDEPSAYAGLEPREARRRMRMYWILAVTERYAQLAVLWLTTRAYALQRSGHVVFEGSIHTSHHRGAILGSASHVEEDPTSALLRHLAHIFSFVDQDVIACWNGRCDRLTCRTLTTSRAVDVLRRLRGSPAEVFSGEESLRNLSDSQKADLLVTWQWIRSRIWRLAAQHGLTKEGFEPELAANYVVDVASTTVAICRRLSYSAMEAHGAGFVRSHLPLPDRPYQTDQNDQVEKLIDIANMIAALIRSTFHAQADQGETRLSTESLSYWVSLLQSLHLYSATHRARDAEQVEKLALEVSSSMTQLRLLGEPADSPSSL
jgi:hypothetical protein